MILKDKNIIITGGTTGIGRGTVYRFATEGAKIVFCARNEAAGKKIESELRGLGHAVDYYKVDIRNPKEVESLVDFTVSKYGTIDVLVNNAAVVIYKELTEITNEEVDQIIDTNVKGMFYCIREVLKIMEKQEGGVIVNMSSMSGIVGHPNFSIYCASKAAINNLTKAAALEYATKNIRINSVAPGTIADTEMTTGYAEKQSNPEEIMAGWIEKEPVKRMGTIDEVVNVIQFLSSEESSFVTGSSYIVDGGFTAGK